MSQGILAGKERYTRRTLSSPCLCTQTVRSRSYVTHISGIVGLIGIDLSDSVAARILTEGTACALLKLASKRARSILVEKLNMSVQFFIHERKGERKIYRAFILLLERKLKLSKLNQFFMLFCHIENY